MTKSVCVVVNSRANYGRIKTFMKAVANHEELELQLIVGASALLYRYGSAVDVMREDGFEPISVVHSIVEGETPTTMAKSTGLGIIELATHFENLKPDIVLTVADRFETLATAVASSYMNIPLAHTQGGEVTGSIDESVRHAITKLAHIHFPATDKAKQNILRMGEDPNYVFCTGCPAMDLLVDTDLSLKPGIFKSYKGVGENISDSDPYVIVLQHPVTTEYGNGRKQIIETLRAVHEFTSNTGTKGVWLWPNVDAGSDDISKAIREYRETTLSSNIHFFKNFSPEDYAAILNNAKMIIGNSSSGIREGSFLGVPCVNIGNRQSNREHADNVMNAAYDKENILSCIYKQYKQRRYKSSKLFGNGEAGKQMASILAKITPNIIKTLHYS